LFATQHSDRQRGGSPSPSCNQSPRFLAVEMDGCPVSSSIQRRCAPDGTTGLPRRCALRNDEGGRAIVATSALPRLRPLFYPAALRAGWLETLSRPSATLPRKRGREVHRKNLPLRKPPPSSLRRPQARGNPDGLASCRSASESGTAAWIAASMRSSQ
jgi:hypothetical protein